MTSLADLIRKAGLANTEAPPKHDCTKRSEHQYCTGLIGVASETPDGIGHWCTEHVGKSDRGQHRCSHYTRDWGSNRIMARA